MAYLRWALILTITTIFNPIDDSYAFYARKDEKNTSVVIFVHGITGNGGTTWTNPDTKAYWPELLKSDPDFSDANIYVYEYPSPTFSKSFTVDEIADNFRLRLEVNDVASNHKRISIVSHSMGGLVTRALLIRYRDLVPDSKIQLLYFFATPTNGTPKAFLAKAVSRNKQWGVLYPLDADSRLATLLHDWTAAKFSAPSYCAYETQDLWGISRIVDQSSAVQSCDDILPLAEDHIGIVKPKDSNADAYSALKIAYRKTRTATPAPPPHNARPTGEPDCRLAIDFLQDNGLFGARPLNAEGFTQPATYFSRTPRTRAEIEKPEMGWTIQSDLREWTDKNTAEK
jgi:pimeloyl-ACP methyl ester carboxylesterase